MGVSESKNAEDGMRYGWNSCPYLRVLVLTSDNSILRFAQFKTKISCTSTWKRTPDFRADINVFYFVGLFHSLFHHRTE